MTSDWGKGEGHKKVTKELAAFEQLELNKLEEKRAKEAEKESYAVLRQSASQVPPVIRKKAKYLYLHGMNETEIANMLNISREVMDYLVHVRKDNPWKKIKENIDDSVVLYFKTMKKEALDDVGGLALDLVKKSIKEMGEEIESGERKLKVAEIKMLNDIVVDLDKVSRLEEGKATHIVKQAGLTVDEAKKILNEDPMALGIVEVNQDDEVEL